MPADGGGSLAYEAKGSTNTLKRKKKSMMITFLWAPIESVEELLGLLARQLV
jgi:hypothetical protein